MHVHRKGEVKITFVKDDRFSLYACISMLTIYHIKVKSHLVAVLGDDHMDVLGESILIIFL